MRRIGFHFLAAASVLLAASSAGTATRPRYGGTLRVEMHARVASLDLREWPSDPADAAATDRLASLVFERLVQLDETGRPQLALAVTWQHDAEFKRWQFRLRPGVKFQDGSALTSAAVAAALEPSVGNDRLVSVSGEWLVIQSEYPMPDLLAELARGRNFIFRLTPEGGVVGTGAFRVAEWQPRRRLVLAANEDYWAGRPFLDSIEIEMGALAPQQLIDLELSKAEVVELWPEQVRRASQAGGRIWSSAPVELLALVFDPRRPAIQDARVRQAVALSIDRAAIANVLLRKQGEIAGGLLPRWLSGYAFLFSTAPNLERARGLAGGRPRAEVSAAPPPGPEPLKMFYDSGDPVARAVAERIVVNAREAGIAMQVSGQAAGGRPASEATSGDARLVRLRVSFGEPRVVLTELAASLELADTVHLGNSPTPEELYAAERAVVETFRVVPLVHLAETFGLAPRVRNWMPRRWGGWRLAEVWLDSWPTPGAVGEKP
jgi:ABC-type transport system substrate-binding protein